MSLLIEDNQAEKHKSREIRKGKLLNGGKNLC